MLTTLLLAGMVAAPLSFTGLVIPVKRHARAAAGRWPAIRRFALAVAATTAVAVAVAASLGLSGISGHDRDAGIAGVVLANLAWLPVTGRWMARARLCWASSIFLVTVYLTVALGWTFASRIGTGQHGRRRAAVGLRTVCRRTVVRLPVGDLRSARYAALAQAASP